MYKRVCRLGLRTIHAPHDLEVFGLKGNDIHDIMFDCLDIQNMFRLKELALKWLDSGACISNLLAYILFYMMQTCDAFIVGERIKYADPLAICEARHKVPNMWENNYDVFKHCETPKEIARE